MQENNNTDTNAQQESPQSILERRLAEINAKRNGAAATTPAAPAAVPAEEKAPAMPEEAPEIKPGLASAAEEKAVEETTTVYVEARSETPSDPEPVAAPAEPVSEVTEPAAPASAPAETVANTDIQAENLPEEAPEVKPVLMTEEEEKESSASTEVFVAAQTETPAAADLTSEENMTAEEDEEEAEAQLDYGSMEVPELRKHLHALLRTDSRKNMRTIQEAHRQYEMKINEERNEARRQFIAGGGEADDFEFRPGKEHQELENAFRQYRENRYKEQQQEEENKQKNLQRKKDLLDSLRSLVEAAETKSSVEQLKEIQAEWKAIGPVPQGEAQELWNSYHALLDIFYNNRSIFFELKELDRKRNLDAKNLLIERAEALVNEPSINKSLAELRHLHEEWKSVGPVPNEQRDAIWERFIQASEKVHNRRREYIAGRKEQETANLAKKQEILKQIEPFAAFNSDRINDWRDKTDEIQAIKEQWDAAGLVPKENADDINKKFWGSYKTFFQHKNQFFKALDEQKMANLRLKTQLCEEAEALKDSEDWDATKERLIQLQKQWKTIGRVPDKYSDKIWNRFRAACNEFFDRRQAEGKRKESELDKLAEEKIAFSDKLAERLVVPCTDCGTMEEYEQLLQQWNNLGGNAQRLNPRVEEKFYALMQKYLDTVPELSNEEKSQLVFQLQVERLKSSPDSNSKLNQKENSLRREITQLENDIRTLKTNIEFFARSKNAEKLREEYEGRIEDARQRIETLQRQLELLHS